MLEYIILLSPMQQMALGLVVVLMVMLLCSRLVAFLDQNQINQPNVPTKEYFIDLIEQYPKDGVYEILICQFGQHL